MIDRDDDRPIAAFDLDGTLIRGDSFLPFLASVIGPASLAIALARGPFRVRDEFKRALIRRTLGGRSEVEICTNAERFAGQISARSWLQRGQIVNLARSLRSECSVGIVTASPQLYAAALAERLGLDWAIGTELAVGSDGCLTGELLGENCRGEAKSRKLAEHFPDRPIQWAVGDSPSDQPMLDLAARPLMLPKWWALRR
ncbi:MAG: HAD-IB family phosphatase [Ilumatobacter sp.]|nr:HAD-IB family phosphatase [Ilumatobacter sp.]